MFFFKRHFGIGVYEFERSHFSMILEKYVKEDLFILDAGCGKEQLWIEKRQPHAVGLDIDFTALRENSSNNVKICADMSKVPFVRNLFEVILSIYTMEHIHDPDAVFKEFSRILKKSGVLILIVPNKLSIFGILAVYLPRIIQNYLWLRLRGKKQPHEIYYKANSLQSVRRLGMETGLALKEYKTIEVPNIWLLEFPFLFKISACCQKILNGIKYLQYFRNLMIIVMQKT